MFVYECMIARAKRFTMDLMCVRFIAKKDQHTAHNVNGNLNFQWDKSYIVHIFFFWWRCEIVFNIAQATHIAAAFSYFFFQLVDFRASYTHIVWLKISRAVDSTIQRKDTRPERVRNGERDLESPHNYFVYVPCRTWTPFRRCPHALSATHFYFPFDRWCEMNNQKLKSSTTSRHLSISNNKFFSHLCYFFVL